MTRTPKEAEQGRLNLIVGASDVGADHQMKLIHNFVSLGFAAMLYEAAATAKMAGIKPEVLIDILGRGGGDRVVFTRLKPYIDSADTSGFSFSMANAAKDMGYDETMAHDLNVGVSIATSVTDAYRQAVEQKPDAKVPALIDLVSTPQK